MVSPINIHSIWFSNPLKPDVEAPCPMIMNGDYVRYPMYMYLGDSNEDLEFEGSRSRCILVENTQQEEDALLRGYDHIHAGMMANKVLINWYWDLEDFSKKQLVIFAKEEFEIDLPIEATQIKLLNAVLLLTRHAPQNCNRIILMAHTIEMNYDETLSTIRKMVKDAPETVVREFVA